MRPCKLNAALVVRIAEALERGDTKAAVYQALRISPVTLNRWIERTPVLSAAARAGAERRDANAKARTKRREEKAAARAAEAERKRAAAPKPPEIDPERERDTRPTASPEACAHALSAAADGAMSKLVAANPAWGAREPRLPLPAAPQWSELRKLFHQMNAESRAAAILQLAFEADRRERTDRELTGGR